MHLAWLKRDTQKTCLKDLIRSFERAFVSDVTAFKETCSVPREISRSLRFIKRVYWQEHVKGDANFMTL